MTDQTSRIFIIDDEPATADSLKLLLESVGFAVKAFYDVDSLLNENLSAADLFLMDVRMPKMDGIELLTVMRQQYGVKTPIILITGHGDIETAVLAMRKGATHFVEKPYRENTLLNAVRECLREHRVAQTRQEPAVMEQLKDLSERQLQILRLIGRGKSSKEIAQELGIQPHTVDNHRSLIKTRLGLNSLTEIVRLACQIET